MSGAHRAEGRRFDGRMRKRGRFAVRDADHETWKVPSFFRFRVPDSAESALFCKSLMVENLTFIFLAVYFITNEN